MEAATENTTETCELSFDRPARYTLLVRLTGSWTIGHKLPSGEEVQRQVESGPAIKQITFDTHQLSGWDSGLLSFLTKIINQCSAKNITVNQVTALAWNLKSRTVRSQCWLLHKKLTGNLRLSLQKANHDKDLYHQLVIPTRGDFSSQM